MELQDIIKQFMEGLNNHTCNVPAYNSMGMDITDAIEIAKQELNKQSKFISLKNKLIEEGYNEQV